MTSLLNTKRPPLFCPGCSHSQVVKALDKALQHSGISSSELALVTDIGCSGLFDTFFNCHAFHGLHGRALTYATGLKMVQPDLHVVVIMGDGGLGIGGAHVLAACRRNLNLTLLVLNNFNYGMTGGQCSATTPPEANTSSGFLNQLETDLDICAVASAAGAHYVDRELASEKSLVEKISSAITYDGFALLDIWGICPGRYLKKNRLSQTELKKEIHSRETPAPQLETPDREYGTQYRKRAATAKPAPDCKAVEKTQPPTLVKRTEILILGAAGQYINTVGEILCLAAMSAGHQASLKTDYPITVLRGHSICEIVLAPEPIGYTGITRPDIILCTSQEGINKKKGIFSDLDSHSIIITDNTLEIPVSQARTITIDYAAQAIKNSQKGVASLGALVNNSSILTYSMLETGLSLRYEDKALQQSIEIISGLTTAIMPPHPA
ncbi:thiamine pyrophosphate-dependent enzyme [Desulfopila sp. IMCC35008]|uniref:thiamine pyrophosphate-dependent enzyme n=1 Tax=Desulfopila sp. IMCC35008 TaxID=2653858 RepID=UPI0013D567B6|nr:thiamine pyrophosphate-dependent enzyme [Desulfopila sp. IMCC35008]